MTYCLAWKQNNRLFFIADSAVSTSRPDDNLDANLSTFGELQDQFDQYYVYERANKISQINDNIAVCFAGDVSIAYDMIRLLEEVTSYGINIDEALSIVNNSSDSNEVRMIIGYKDSTESRLFLISNNEIEENNFFEIGSGSAVSDFSESVKKWFEFNYPIDHLLSIMVVLLQSEPMTKFMMPFGVGGTFNGFELNSNGSKWCSDLSYCFYNNNKVSEGFITAINRWGFLATSSTFNSMTKIFTDYSQEIKGLIPNEDGVKSISDELTNVESDYLILTNINRRKILMIYIDRSLHNSLFRMWRRKRETETDYLLVFGDDIGDYIFSSKHGDDDEMTFHFLDISKSKQDYISLKEFEEMSGGQGNLGNVEDFY